MKQRKGPYPSPSAVKQWAAMDTSPMIGTLSGEITASRAGVPLGAANVAGKISAVWLTLGACGRDDVNPHTLTIDVKINGTTCLTTQPYIDANNASASAQKTTKATGDTGIQQAGVSSSANSVSLGDLVSFDATLTRTASPTTEMANAVVVVEIEPN